jgi:glycosyltransferase involved in cell wall biosynthesis
MILSQDITHDSRVNRHANALGEIGHEVVLLCRPSAADQARHEHRENYTIIRYYYPEQWVTARRTLGTPPRGRRSKLIRKARSSILFFLSRLRLYFLAVRIRAHAYYCNDLDTLDVGVVMKIVGKKVVYDSHELYIDALPPGRRRRMYGLFERLFVNFADVLITVNPFIAQELRGRYKIAKRIHVVLNCPDAYLQPPNLHGSKTVTVLYHGGLEIDRGLETLVLASENFREGIRLVIRGEGTLENALKQLASENSNVSFERSVPMSEVVRNAANADIGILPYVATNLNNYYCSPNKLFEYIQAGLAIVTSDLPFLRKFVISNGVGVVMDPKDQVDVAQKVNFVSEEKNLLKFKRNSLEARERYTWENERNRLYAAIGALET